MERRMAGEKIKASKEYAASLGEMVGSMPLDYRWEGDKRERAVVEDAAWAPVVRRVFDDYATDGYSSRPSPRV
jgi:hypothetical protein